MPHPDPRFPRRRSRRFLSPVVVAFALVAASCTGGSSSGSTTTDPDSQQGNETTTVEGTPQPETDPVGEAEPGIEPLIDPTPLPVDANVRIGTLENGLTYYLRRNDAPGGKLSVRLAVNAGSLQQAEATDNIAHFAEHMLFNGTTKYPGNSLDAELRALGSQIGPDLNAYTSFDETVYQLEVPLVGSNAATAFTVLREWAGNALMDPSEVINERGVVREEFRLSRQVAAAAVSRRIEEAYLDGTPYEDRAPIGTEEQIVSTTDADTRAFYDRWYRPDNMAVVAVGDLPLDELEAFVTGQFSDLEARGDEHPPREEPEVDIATPQVVDVVADPGLDGTFISLDYRTPSRNSGTFGGEKLDQWDSLIGSMLTARIEESITSGTSSLVRGGGGPFSVSRQMSFLGFNFDGPDLAAGTGEFLTLVKTIARDGFTQRELDRVKEQAEAGLDQELAQIGTRQDNSWANLYADHFLSGADASDPNDRRERMLGVLDDTGPEEINGYFRWLMETSAPIIVVVGPDAAALPSVEELTAVVEGAGAIDSTGDDFEPIDKLMDRPDRVDIAAERTLEEAGGQEWTFENGARVIFSESQISEGVVSLFGLSRGGWSKLPPQEQPLLGVATSMVNLSGVADLQKVAMDRYLADKVAGVTPFTYETGEGFQGSASPEDLEIAFQLIHLFLTEARIDESAFNRVVVQEAESLRSVQNSPQAASNEALALAINDGEQDRNPILDRATLDSLTPEKALDLYNSRLNGVDDLVLVVVGDIDEGDVEDLARRYIGTVRGKASDSWVDLLEDRAPGVVTEERIAGPAGGAGILTMLFSTPTEFSDADRVHAEVLQALLQERLFTRIREDLGASYNGGSASVSFIDEPDNESQLFISVAGDPERLDEIRSTLLAELTDLDVNGPSDAEFSRAVAVIEDNYNFISNGEIIDALLEESLDGSPVLTKQAGARIVAETGRSDIAVLAAEVIDTDSWIEVFVRPDE